MTIMDKPFLKIVQFEENDIPCLINLFKSIGWDYDQNEIKTVMTSGKIYGHKSQ